ncbi:unnamed protein product [Paramecium pentaurelia]|uniref:Uncharacterized protein n=1 Tax=Paramecium pentaurelia TaxID=43138 RepID=A0A8S1SLC7_9CILI|nr:unnamed protein product [Paramecium pentaurelia]
MADQEDQQKIQQQVEEENVDQYSYSEGDQYESDSDNLKFDIVKPEKNPFRPIGIDFQKIQQIAHLAPNSKEIQQEEENRKKIEAYNLYQQKVQEADQNQKELEKQIEEKLNQKKEEELQNLQKQPLELQINKGGQLVNADEIQKIIYPWQVLFDDTWKKNYYYNPVTKESVWELPLDIVQKLSDYRRQFEHRLYDYQERNFFKFLPKQYIARQREQLFQKRQKVMLRPARKQVEESLATKFGYKQGDEEYNTWFDRFLSDGNKYKEKDPALTRMHPDIDSGYTKADLYEKFSTYFCIFFARGCCAEGVNCRYYHRIPTMDECEQIDNSKDVFGRTRFANHREDMKGIGCFTSDTRAIYITHYKMPKAETSTQALALMYDTLWRHFSPLGDIDDLNVIPAKGVSFIRYKHRCQAEFAKEAMDSQALDQQECIMCKWAYEDPNPKAMSREFEEEKLKLVNAVKDKEKKEQQNNSQFRKKIDGQHIRDRSQDDRKGKRGGDRGNRRGGLRGRGDNRGRGGNRLFDDD